MSLNLSAIAVRERAVTLFFIVILAAAGVYAFLMLGREQISLDWRSLGGEQATSEPAEAPTAT